MKKIYLLAALWVFLFSYNTLRAQCSVSIITTPGVTLLDCNTKSLKLTANANGKGEIKYKWSTGETSEAISVKEENTYTVAITDKDNCTSSASIIITKNTTPPTVSALALPETACAGGTVKLIGVGGDSYTWRWGNDSATGAVVSVTPSATTDYTVTGMAANGCSNTATIRVPVSPPATARINGTAAVCQNSPAQVVLKGSGGNTPYTFAYNINGGATQTIQTVGTSDSVKLSAATGTLGDVKLNLLSVTDKSGCTNLQSGTAIITVLPGPVLTSRKDTTICNNTQFTYTAVSSATNTSFTWTRAAVPDIANAAGSDNKAIVSETLRNTTASPVVVAYIFRLSSGTGCETQDTVKVTVNPTPQIEQIPNATFCSGGLVSGGIAFKSPSPNTTFTWTNNNPRIGLPESGSGSIPSFIATNAADTSITATITVKVSAGLGSCAGSSQTFKITVRPGPVLTSVRESSTCNKLPFTYTAQSSADSVNFSWKRIERDSITVQGSGSGNVSTFTETLTNPHTRPVVVTYVITLSPKVNNAGCAVAQEVRVTVNPTPSVTLIKDTSVCNGTFLAQGISFASNTTNAAFTWAATGDTIGLPHGGNGFIPPFVALNTTNSSLKTKVTVTATVGNSCPGDSSRSFTITVLPGPALTSAKETSVCNNTVFNYLAKSSAVGLTTSFKWERLPTLTADSVSATGPAADTTNTITNTLFNTGTKPKVIQYAIELSTGTGCITREIVDVTVNPSSKINAIRNDTVCNGTFMAGGIAFTSPSPNASFRWTNSDTSINLPASGNGNILPFNVKNTTSSPVTATITVYIKASSDSCAGESSRTFTIMVLPGPALTSRKDTAVCNNSPFTYTATSSAVGTIFTWKRLQHGAIISNRPAAVTVLGAGISDTLLNHTAQPVQVLYALTLSTGSGCVTYDTLRLTVNPTPVTNRVADKTYCNNTVAEAIEFTSPTQTARFTWKSNQKIGFGNTGTVRIPAFLTNNPGNSPITANVTVSISVGNGCRGADSMFNLTVNPTPVLSSAKTASVCNDSLFSYTASSSVAGTGFTWIRMQNDSISSPVRSGATHLVSDTLKNPYTQPVKVYYVFTMRVGGGCDIPYTDSVLVTVNPTPTLDSLTDGVYCNRAFVSSGISFSSSSPDSSFIWTNNNPRIGLPESGSGSIPGFVATNKTAVSDSAMITVGIKASTNGCVGQSQAFKIIVRPSPQHPYFTSLTGKPDSTELVLCQVSQNINFNVTSPINGVRYTWSTPSPVSSAALKIRDIGQANTVVSFFQPGAYKLQVTASDRLTGCTDTAVQNIRVNANSSGIDTTRKIFMMQPGDLLVYPDNSLQGYQWGYNEKLSDSAYGPPVAISGQVNQFFVPSTKPDTSRFLYWVLLQNGPGCYTRVYYNGPFKHGRLQVQDAVNSTVQLQVLPNPVNNNFRLLLQGNIYGKVDARIYNSSGQVVFRKTFVKTVPVVNELFVTNQLPGGIYYIDLQSSDLKKVSSRFVVQH